MGFSTLNNLVILQARTSSSRLPGKVLKIINGKSMIEWQILRIQQSMAKKIVLATSVDESDNDLVEKVRALGIEVFRGSLTDVHSRYLEIIKIFKPENFIRLTGDCPLVMPNLIDEMISEFRMKKFGYFSNINPPSFPDGLDVEIISTELFLEFSLNELSKEEKEHVTLGLRRQPAFSRHGNFESRKNLSNLRWTVDYPEDFIFVENVFKFFEGREVHFNIDDILHAVELGKIRDNQVSHNFRNISLMDGGKIV